MTTSKKAARFTALKALLAVDVKDGYSNLVLNNILRQSDLSKADVNLVSAIFYGVLERKLTLDHIIKTYSKIRFNKISTDVVEILRIGLYQLLYMDKIPQSAAVNESVNLAKLIKKKSSAGFINGILRSFIRDGVKINLPDKKKTPIKYLSIKYSCPPDIIKLWLDSYGFDITNNILSSLIGRPNLTVRVNTIKTDKETLLSDFRKQGLEADTVKIINNAIEIKSSGSIEQNELYKNGNFYVQDISSQICCLAIDAKPGQEILDVCAAPGGKSLTIAQIMKNQGKILACDIHANKLNLINSNAERLGIEIIKTEERDATSSTTPSIKLFDRVLCDVPCSGLGVIRRKPEVRYKKFENLKQLYELQYKILCNSANFLKPGGILLYSTCTLNKNENNYIADKFLKEHERFRAFDLNLPKSILRNNFEPPHQHTFLPGVNNTDGFFMAAFILTE